MQKEFLIALLCGALLLATACSPAQSPSAAPGGQPAARPPVAAKVLLVTGEYAPYTGEKLPDKGFFSRIVAGVFQDMGIEYELRFYPWARCEDMVRRGEAWAAFPYGPSARIAKTYATTQNVYAASHKYFYLKTNDRLAANAQNFADLADFKGYTFGGANGYWYGSRDDLRQRGLDRIEWANDIDGLVKMLYNQRIDIFVEDELVGWEAIRRIYPQATAQFTTLPNVAQTREYFLIVSKTYPQSAELLAKFNAALRLAKEQGRVEATADAGSGNK